MFASLKKLIAEFGTGGKHPARFDDDDYRLAAAALLVHAAEVDGDGSPAVRDRVRAVLQRRFELDDEDITQLVAEATAAEHAAIDLYHFTSRLNRALDDAGRRRVVQMMWEIVCADSRVTEIEDNLIWRAADLLGVSSRERIVLRRQVEAARPNPDGENK